MLGELKKKLKEFVFKEENYENRFLKFYHQNKKRLIKERKESYHLRRKKGICVRCKRNAIKGIVFCEYRQQKQKEYNRKARSK